MLPNNRHWSGGHQPGGHQLGVLQPPGRKCSGRIWSANMALEPGFELGRIKSGDKVTLPFIKLTQ